MKVLTTLFASRALGIFFAGASLAASHEETPPPPASTEAPGSVQSTATPPATGAGKSSPVREKVTTKNACWNAGQYCDANDACCEGLA